jgi:hypothetical protein
LGPGRRGGCPDAAGARIAVIVSCGDYRIGRAEKRWMAVGGLKSLLFLAKAPASRIGWMPKISNPNNHMRPAGGGAFILPS